MTTLFRRAAATIAFIGISGLAACASTDKHEGTGEYVDDTMITARVKAAVMSEPSLKSSEINVETFKGRVQMSGFVKSQADIEAAMKVALGVKGVSSVANDMRLK